MRGIRDSGFSRCDRLPAGVIAALAADAVRAPRSTALRTGLQYHRRRLLVRVTRALLAFGRSSFRYGHVRLPGLSGAWTRAPVQVGTATRAQAPAIGTAEHERGYFQQPAFPDRRAEIHLRPGP